MSAKKTDFIVTDLISKIFQRKTIMDKLPSQRELAGLYHVSRFTIQKVMSRLQSIGLIYMTQGDGTYVNKRALGHPMVYNSLTEAGRTFQRTAAHLQPENRSETVGVPAHPYCTV